MSGVDNRHLLADDMKKGASSEVKPTYQLSLRDKKKADRVSVARISYPYVIVT